MKLSIKPFLLALTGIAVLSAGCGDDKESPELLSVEQAELSVDAAAGSKTVATFDARAEWTVASAAEWLTVSPESGIARAAAEVVITAAENLATGARIGYVTIRCGAEERTLTITQRKKEFMTLQGRRQAFTGRNGGSVVFALETNVDEPVVEISEEAKGWLRLADAQTPGRLEFSASPNGGALRVASVKIGNRAGTAAVSLFIVQTDTEETDWENRYYTTGGNLKEVVPADAHDLILYGTPGVEDFRYMCDRLQRLSSLDLSHTAITEIPDNAFYNEEQYKNYFTTIVFPATLTRIGDRAFYECYSLQSEPFDLPAGLEEIGDQAFFGCPGLRGVLTLPDGLRIIGKEAFGQCTGFAGDLVIPGSVTSIGANAFGGCTGFEKQRLILSEGITEVGDSAFTRGSFETGVPRGFSSVSLPSTLKKIGTAAFSGCTGFTKLSLPEGLTHIGDQAFSYCDGVTQLVLPKSLLHIGEVAFVQCFGLKGPLILPDGLISIGKQAFQSCRGLTGGLVIPNSVTSIGEWAFCSCTGLDGGLTISKNLETLSFGLFMDCPGLKGELIIPNGVKKIEAQAFANTGFTGALIIPDGVTEIGGNAFSDGRFEGDLIIPNSVTAIKGRAFGGCDKLGDKLVIPAGVTKIDTYAFIGCSGFTEVYCCPEEPVGSWGIWEDTNPEKKLYVPAGSVEKYKANAEWRKAFNDGANIFPMSEQP